MSSTKRKVYIVVIIIAFSATGLTLYLGLKPTNAPPPHSLAVTPDAGTQAIPNSAVTVNGNVIYNPPAVFPNDTKFDWTLLSSDAFKTLHSIPDLTLDKSQIGRPNPFSR